VRACVCVVCACVRVCVCVCDTWTMNNERENAIKMKDLEIKFVIHIGWVRWSNISKTSKTEISNTF